MRTILFRDDDTSFFTSPQRLQAVYAPLWAAGAPVCLAVIPAVAADTRVYWTAGNPHDPAIPPAYRGQQRRYPILDNPELCVFLNELAAAGLVEICLHGWAHSFFEFISQDRAYIAEMLDRGMALLERAFPAAPIRTFIPPYDRISPTALRELLRRGFHISTMSHNLAPLPELPQLAGFAAGAMNRRQQLFVCDDYLFSYQRDPAESLRRARMALAENALTIVSSHYWMFFHPWREQPNPRAIAAWNAFVGEALALPDSRITSFSAYAAQSHRSASQG